MGPPVSFGQGGSWAHGGILMPLDMRCYSGRVLLLVLLLRLLLLLMLCVIHVSSIPTLALIPGMYRCRYACACGPFT